MIITDELSREDSLQIATAILDVFQKLGINIDLKLNISNNFNFPQLTTIACRSNNKIEITTTQAKNGEEKFFQELPNHIYKLIWYNRLFLVSFYTSPKIWGYYSALPNYDKIPYLFCSIIEMQNRIHKKYEMNFGFNSETHAFLELFDVEHHILDDFIKECRDTNSVESKLRGKILF